MGYNTVLVVLNDRLSEIEKDPEFGKKVADAIRAHGIGQGDSRVRKVYITGQTEVISCQHADIVQVVRVSGNCGRLLGYGGFWKESDDDVIKNLNRERLTRKKQNVKKA